MKKFTYLRSLVVVLLASFSTLAFADNYFFNTSSTTWSSGGYNESLTLGNADWYLEPEGSYTLELTDPMQFVTGTWVKGATKIVITGEVTEGYAVTEFGLMASTLGQGVTASVSIGGDEVIASYSVTDDSMLAPYFENKSYTGSVVITIENPNKADVLLEGITFTTTMTELPKVTVTPGPGTYDEPQDVVLTCGTGNSFSMYYTLDGSNPDPMFGSTSTWNGEGKKIHIAKSCTLKVVVFDNTGSTERTGDVEEFYYTINAKVTPEAPTANIKGNTYKQAVTVTLSQQFGAKIIYTIDGTEPIIRGKNTLEYEGSILIDKTTTLKFRAVDEENNLMSEVVTEEYIIEIPTAVDNVAVNFSVYAQDGAVVVETEEADALIEVFSVTGQRVAALRSVSDVTVIDGVDAGVAIVRVNGKACKVVVR